MSSLRQGDKRRCNARFKDIRKKGGKFRREWQEKREKLCTEAADAHSALIRKVRDICDFLVPPDFRFHGLGDALRRFCLDYGKRTGIDCRIDITENLELGGLSEEKQLQIFRIVQEALSNVEKHAFATEAIVILRPGSGKNIFIGISAA